MCRYAWRHYRDHFACFDCRRTFKSWQWEEADTADFRRRQRLRHVPREFACPNCSQPMADMGLDFKAPPSSDRPAWEIMRALYHHGFTFHSCGCSVGFTPPRTLREVPRWIQQHRHRSEGERLLGKIAARRHRHSRR